MREVVFCSGPHRLGLFERISTAIFRLGRAMFNSNRKFGKE